MTTLVDALEWALDFAGKAGLRQYDISQEDKEKFERAKFILVQAKRAHLHDDKPVDYSYHESQGLQ